MIGIWRLISPLKSQKITEIERTLKPKIATTPDTSTAFGVPTGILANLNDAGNIPKRNP